VTLFECVEYKQYLQALVTRTGARSGYRAALARHIGCQPTYLSQVLHGSAHLSLEQADSLNIFLNHSGDESKYFLLMVQRDRAGTESLRQYFQREMKEMIDRNLATARTLSPERSLDEQGLRARYYSSWHYAAVHMALMIQDLRTPHALSAELKLPVSKVMEVINTLLSSGLIEVSANNSYKCTQKTLRLTNKSPELPRHHTNWRIRAIESLDNEGLNDLHYSAVITLSLKDVQALKRRMLKRVNEDLEALRPSPEEELYCLNLDLFSLRR
jgi:uncharacterized protein (TIGR02147 family)